MKAYTYKFWERSFLLTSMNSLLEGIYKKYISNKNNLVVLDVGCGKRSFKNWVGNKAKSYFGIDITKDSHADILGDAKKLPFKDKTFDLVICTAVLEHDPYPRRIVSEIRRVLKNEGLVISAVPFAETTHGSPNDFSRLTYFGVRSLFMDFSRVEIHQGGGFFLSIAFILGEKYANLRYSNIVTRALGKIGVFDLIGFFFYPILNIPAIILNLLTFKDGFPTEGAFPLTHWVVAEK